VETWNPKDELNRTEALSGLLLQTSLAVCAVGTSVAAVESISKSLRWEAGVIGAIGTLSAFIALGALEHRPTVEDEASKLITLAEKKNRRARFALWLLAVGIQGTVLVALVHAFL
jgi:hypothetical protein